jgi:hypothetical protein
MNKAFFDNKIIYLFLIIILIIAAIFGAIAIKKFIGYVVSIPAEGGYITEVIIDHRTQSSYWQAFYGLVFTERGYDEEQTATAQPGGISSQTFVFDCVSPTEDVNELYASTKNSIDFDNIQAGTVEMIDIDFLNISPTEKDSATNTFTENLSIMLGSTNISGIPAVYTYVNSMPNTTFFTGILNSSGDLVIVSNVLLSSVKGYKGTKVKYQMLVPVKNNSITYYFFSDPNDVCPAGYGTGIIGDGVITGYVFEDITGNPLENVTISLGGVSNKTDANGFYNITVPIGSYNIVGIKDGYNTHVGTVNISLALTTYYNFTMSLFPGYEQHDNGTIFGVVRDNATNETIANATITIAGRSTNSNASGNYSINVPGNITHVITAIKTGYDNFIGNISVGPNKNKSYDIYMSKIVLPTAGSLLNNGTVEGLVTDNSTNELLSNVTVSIAGNSFVTNSSGNYSLDVIEGTHNIVAIKTGYNNYISNVTVEANETTIHNISMTIYIPPLVGAGNGSVRGLVKTSSGSLLTGVTVSIAGKSNISNSTGWYFLSQIPAGTHNIVATKSGYDNYIGTVNVTAGNITEHNITMTVSAEVGAGAGAGAGTGAGAGAGAGKGTGMGAGTGIIAQPIVEQPTTIVDYEISIKRIIKKIRVGNFVSVPIDISNYRDESIMLSFSIEGNVKPLIKLNKEKIIIGPNSDGEFELTILGNVEPGVYEGNLVISGDIDKKIPINILVYNKEKLPIEALIIKLIPLKRKVYVGGEFKFRIDLQNMLSEGKYIVSLSYSIEGINNNKSIFIETEDIIILTSYSLLKTFIIPKDIEPGDYVLSVKADYLDLTSTHKTPFRIVEPIYKYSLLGIIPLWLVFIAVSVLSVSTFSVMVYKKKAAEKKRYKIEVDYAQLPKAGARSAFVGNIAETNNKTYFDLDQFQVHTLVAGASGSGKTIAAQDLVEEALLKKVAVIVFDPTAQWTGFLRKCEDKKMLSLYRNFGMKKTDAKAFNGNIHLITNPREIINIKKFMKPGEINIFVTNKLDTKGNELFVANTIREIFHANLPESKELIFLMIYDGIHSLLPKFGGSGKVFMQVERATREFRKWGVGLILISQVLSDFPPEVLANINTEIQMRTRDENDLKRIKEEYGEDILKSVVKAAVGTGMVENSSYNKGKPYFVSFRPLQHGIQRLSDEELEQYNKYNAIIDDLEYQIEQLEKEGIDIFDLKLELKMALDKVKSGSFNMVNIYLESLTPRIKTQWKKLGKQPKKREIKLVSEAELKEELEKAEEEKKKHEKEETKNKEGEEKKDEVKEEQNKKQEKENNEKNLEQYPKKKEDNKGDIERINNLIKEVYTCLKNNQKDKARALYSNIGGIYKNLPKEAKTGIFNKCVDIQKRLVG